MRKYITTILLLSCTMIVCAQKTKQLTILHTNDTHSCIYPLHETLKDTTQAGRGGFLRRVEMLKEERAKQPNLLLIDSGDFSQGSPYYTFFGGDVEVELMNRMGYDAAAIGNHEFDNGLENMARIFKKAKFPILMSSYDFTGTPVEGLTKRWHIIKRNGIKIGLYALGPEFRGLVLEQNYKKLGFLDPVEVANEMGDFLKNKKKCDLVICISHLGWDSKGYNEQVVFAQTHNTDIVLGGHSHTYMKKIQTIKDADGKIVYDDQNGKSGIWVGRLLVEMKKKTKK